METKYLVYWFIHDAFSKGLTRREFDSLADAEAFAKANLKDCVYSIRKVREAK